MWWLDRQRAVEVGDRPSDPEEALGAATARELGLGELGERGVSRHPSAGRRDAMPVRGADRSCGPDRTSLGHEPRDPSAPTVAEPSGSGPETSDAAGTRGIETQRSIRSRSGPDTRRL